MTTETIVTTKATEAALAGEELPEGVTIGETKRDVLSKIKQIIRYISSIPDPKRARYSVTETDEYISYWITEHGYELFNTHYLGEVLDTETGAKAFGFMYVLVIKD